MKRNTKTRRTSIISLVMQKYVQMLHPYIFTTSDIHMHIYKHALSHFSRVQLFVTLWTVYRHQKSDDCKSVQFSRSVVSDSLWSHELQHARLPCPSPTPQACSNSCPSSWWCHSTILSSVIPFSFWLQSFPASGSFPMNQFFASGGQSIAVSVSAPVLPMNIQDCFPWGLTGWISLLSKQLSRVFSNTTVQKHQFLGA